MVVPMMAGETDTNPTTATTPSLRSGASPNVLMIVSDDLRASVLGCYGDEVTRTPNIDALAQRGTLFRHAHCQATWCLPSRRSFMRSRYFDASGPTLGETLRRAGVRTARVGKIFHMRVPGDIVEGTDGEDVPECWDERFNCSGDEAHSVGRYACLNQNVFQTEMDGRQGAGTKHRAFVTVEITGNGDDQPDTKAAFTATRWMTRKKESPFFLAVGFVRPHYPMVAPESIFRRYPHASVVLPVRWSVSPSRTQIPKIGWSGSRSEINGIDRYPENQRRMWSGYRASVEFMDVQVGRLMTTLDDLDLDESTWIVFTSDHGYHLGDHTFWQKSNLHEQVTRVPLIVVPPRGAAASEWASRSIDIPVELVDLYPTICDWMGVASPNFVQGTSLTNKLRRPTETASALTTMRRKGDRHNSLRTKRYALIKYEENVGELYDMHEDPNQTRNLFDDPTHASTRQRLESILQTRLENL